MQLQKCAKCKRTTMSICTIKRQVGCNSKSVPNTKGRQRQFSPWKDRLDATPKVCQMQKDSNVNFHSEKTGWMQLQKCGKCKRTTTSIFSMKRPLKLQGCNNLWAIHFLGGFSIVLDMYLLTYTKTFAHKKSNFTPSSIYSWSIGHILEHEFFF